MNWEYTEEDIRTTKIPGRMNLESHVDLKNLIFESEITKLNMRI